jgi:hypothetical protein
MLLLGAACFVKEGFRASPAVREADAQAPQAAEQEKLEQAQAAGPTP